MIEDIGIGILDIFTPEDLKRCLDSIPLNLKENVYVVSNSTFQQTKFSNFSFTKDCGISSLRNNILYHFQKTNKKYVFMLYSNLEILNNNFFSDSVKKAHNFGTWFMTGPGKDSLPIEDESNQLILDVSPEIRGEAIFILTNLIKKIGYFNEQFLNSSNLEILDFTQKLRQIGAYPPFPFNSTLGEGLKINNKPDNKIKYKTPSKVESLSYGLFQYLHNFVPGHNDPAGCTSNEMFKKVEEIQKNYAKSF